MKKIMYSAVITVMSVFILSSCGGGKGQTPEAVAEKYVAAFLKMDFSTMKKYASADELKNLEEQEGEVKNAPEEKKELMKALAAAKTTVQPAVIDEATPDIAKVNVDYTMMMEGKESTGVWKVDLVKEDGQWKVDGLSLK